MEGLNITKCPNLYIKHEDYAEILLQNKKGEIIASALVDLEDLDKVILYRLTFHRGYAFSFRHRMHRVVLGLDRPDFNDHTTCIDHINGDTLDNRKSNLRVCTKIENAQHAIKPRIDNTSGAIGVSRYGNGKYRAYITVHKKTIGLGQYDTFEDAVKARLEAEIEYFGEYRGCNSKFSYLLED